MIVPCDYSGDLDFRDFAESAEPGSLLEAWDFGADSGDSCDLARVLAGRIELIGLANKFRVVYLKAFSPSSYCF